MYSLLFSFLVQGKLTPFAQTILTVEGARPPPGPSPPGPNPGPTPPPGPGPFPPAPPSPPAQGKLFLSIILNFEQATPQQASVVNNQQLRQALAGQNVVLGIFPHTSPVLQPPSQQNPQGRNLLPFAQPQGLPAVVVQDERGKVLFPKPPADPRLPAEKLPSFTVDALLQLVGRIRNGG
jgi:hypothetical protein